MLKITRMKLLARNLEPINKNSIIDRVDTGSKIGRAKSQVNFQANFFMSNNMIKPNFLTKSKWFVKPSSRSGFLTPKAKLAFDKLRQVFIKISILYYFDPKCHIWVKTDVSSYIIGTILSQLTLDNLSY